MFSFDLAPDDYRFERQTSIAFVYNNTTTGETSKSCSQRQIKNRNTEGYNEPFRLGLQFQPDLHENLSHVYF